MSNKFTEVSQENRSLNNFLMTAEDLLRNFDYCFFRFADLHSWYKYPPKKVSCTVIPVMGNVQECRNGPAFDPTQDVNVYPNQVFWHFFDTEWSSPPDEKLQTIITENQVHLDSLRELYNSRFDVEMGKTKEDYKFNENEEKSWENYHVTYDKFRNAANIIVSFLVKNPKIIIPHVKFADSFLPLRGDEI